SKFIKGGLGDQFTNWIKTLTTYLKSPEFKAAMQQIVTWLSTNLPLAIAWIRDVGFPALVNAFKTVWPVVETLLKWLKSMISYMKDNEWVIWGLITVLGTLKAAFAIAGAINAFKTSLKAARTAYILTKTVLSASIPITIVVGAALIAMGLIIAKAKETMGVLDQLG